MLNAHHGKLHRAAGLGLAAGLALSGLLIAAPAAADEPKEKTVVEKKVTVVHGDGRTELGRRGGEMNLNDCPGTVTVVESTPAGTDTEKKRAKIALCAQSSDKAEIASGLEKALARVEKDGEMDAAVRADLSAKLRAKIAEVRGQ